MFNWPMIEARKIERELQLKDCERNIQTLEQPTTQRPVRVIAFLMLGIVRLFFRS